MRVNENLKNYYLSRRWNLRRYLDMMEKNYCLLPADKIAIKKEVDRRTSNKLNSIIMDLPPTSRSKTI
jgi:hypothetical protein